jgi:hypothetical protein
VAGRPWHVWGVRSLSEAERGVLVRLLSVEFEGVEALRRQADNIFGVELNYTCGCPSITLHVDRGAAPPATCSSPLPAELAEMARADGVPRTVLCFLDDDGYMANLECVYYDDARPGWPKANECAVLLRDAERYLEAVALPSGAVVRPHQPGDRWVSFEEKSDGGFCAATWSGYRECFAGGGSELTRIFVK